MSDDDFHKHLRALEHKSTLKSEDKDDDLLDLDFVRRKIADLEAAVEERDRTIKSQTEQLKPAGKRRTGKPTRLVDKITSQSKWDAMDNALRKLKAKSDAELEALLAQRPRLPDTLYYSVRSELQFRKTHREYVMADDLF